MSANKCSIIVRFRLFEGQKEGQNKGQNKTRACNKVYVFYAKPDAKNVYSRKLLVGA